MVHDKMSVSEKGACLHAHDERRMPIMCEAHDRMNRRIWKKITKIMFAGLLAVALVLSAFPLFSLTADAAVYNGSNIITNNIHGHMYSDDSRISNSYLVDNKNGTFSRVENMGDIMLLETYNSAFQLTSQVTVKSELPKFGGFYAGTNYNYFVFGQDNPSKSPDTEVLRIVRYSKGWTRQTSFSLTNINSMKMFDGGNLDFAEYGDMLYIRCSHVANDGVQGSLTLAYKNSTNRVTDVQYMVNPKQGNYAGTQAQYIDAEGGVLSAVDARKSPYAVTFSRYFFSADQASFHSDVKTADCLGKVNAVNGADSRFTVGGYASSPQYHLAVGTTTPLDGKSLNRNVYVAAVPKNNFAAEQVTLSFLTGYANGATQFCDNPFLVKISADGFLVLWETKNGTADMEQVSYVMVDGRGNKISAVNTVEGCLSDCQPVVFQGRVIWYTTNGRDMKIYAVSVPATGPAAAGQSSGAGNNVYKGVDYSAVYDFNYYCNKYPDIRVLYGGKPDAALAHFVKNGMAEGRQGCENFNVTVYKDNYADLRAAYGNNLKAYYMHFINNGSKEGRNGRTKR